MTPKDSTKPSARCSELLNAAVEALRADDEKWGVPAFSELAAALLTAWVQAKDAEFIADRAANEAMCDVRPAYPLLVVSLAEFARELVKATS